MESGSNPRFQASSYAWNQNVLILKKFVSHYKLSFIFIINFFVIFVISFLELQCKLLFFIFV